MERIADYFNQTLQGQRVVLGKSDGESAEDLVYAFVRVPVRSTRSVERTISGANTVQSYDLNSPDREERQTNLVGETDRDKPLAEADNNFVLVLSAGVVELYPDATLQVPVTSFEFLTDAVQPIVTLTTNVNIMTRQRCRGPQVRAA